MSSNLLTYLLVNILNISHYLAFPIIISSFDAGEGDAGGWGNIKSLSISLYERERLISPFEKGGLRGILGTDSSLRSE
jgi:hypothetical protein